MVLISQISAMPKIYLILLMAFPLFSFGQNLTENSAGPQQELIGFKMYPNPAYGDEIYLTTNTNGNKKITIYDVFGDIVLTDLLAGNSLNISRLVPGVYVLQVAQGNKTLTRKLVVK